MDNTSRPADQEGVPSVDLSTMIAGTGLEIEIPEKTDLVAGLLYHSYSGFEFMRTRQMPTEILSTLMNSMQMDLSGWVAQVSVTVSAIRCMSWGSTTTLALTMSLAHYLFMAFSVSTLILNGILNMKE